MFTSALDWNEYRAEDRACRVARAMIAPRPDDFGGFDDGAR